MPSVDDLREEWLKLRAAFTTRMDAFDPAQTISSEAEYARNAWHNRLHVWCAELDELLCEYTIVKPHGHEARHLGVGRKSG